MKVSSREPKSCNIACFTASLVVKGPGVNRSLSLVLMRQFGPWLTKHHIEVYAADGSLHQDNFRFCAELFAEAPFIRRRIIAEGNERVDDGLDERLLSRFSVLAIIDVYTSYSLLGKRPTACAIASRQRHRFSPVSGKETRNRRVKRSELRWGWSTEGGYKPANACVYQKEKGAMHAHRPSKGL